MASFQKVFAIGNMGRDPEMRYTPNGKAVANFSIAVNEKWTDQGGQKQEKTEWLKCVAWGKVAELITQYCHKGSQIFIEGRLQTRDWEDKDGNKRQTTEVNVLTVQFLDARGQDADKANGGAGQDAPGFDDVPW